MKNVMRTLLLATFLLGVSRSSAQITGITITPTPEVVGNVPLAVTFGLWSALCAWPETSAQEQTANVEVVTGCIDCARKIEIPQDAAELAAL